MSYCVNCGVKLAESEKVCPLCNTPVIIPNASRSEYYEPYPSRIERQAKAINKTFVALLGIFILLIPVSVGLIFQIISGFKAAWPLYVYGGCAVAFFTVLFPLYFKKPNVYICLAIDGIIVALYALLIAALCGGVISWYLPLALPIIALAFVITGVCILICRIKKLGILPKIAIVLYIIAFSAVLLEVILAISAYKSFMLIWCWYVLAVLCIIATILFIINSRADFADQIRRRLFA